MTYYIVERPSGGGEVKIVRDFEKPAHKMPVLYNYLNENNIKAVENKEDIKGSGKYCVPNGLNKYRIYNMYKDIDGYIFNGGVYSIEEYDLNIVYYKLTENHMRKICDMFDI